MTPLTRLLNSCINLLYPAECLLCQAHLFDHIQSLCPACQDNIIFNKPPFCRKCSRHISRLQKGHLCQQCWKRPPEFDQAWGAVFYNEPMRHLLHSFKYQKKTVLRYFFSDLLLSSVDRYQIPIKKFDFLIPMPIHSAKYREREFNQTELLAHLVSKKINIPIYINNLIRVKATAPQAFLEEKERWTNIQDAFRIRKPFELKNKSILIIDDLLTTGATACEAAKTCKNAGAASVSILTLAIGE